MNTGAHETVSGIVARVLDLDVRLTKDDEEVACASGLEIATHIQIGVHARFQNRHSAKLVELSRVSVVVEGAGNQQVEADVACLSCSQYRTWVFEPISYDEVDELLQGLDISLSAQKPVLLS